MGELLCFSQSCGLCKSFTKYNSGIACGIYGFCEKLEEHTHSSLVCVAFQNEPNVRDNVVNGLRTFKKENERKSPGVK